MREKKLKYMIIGAGGTGGAIGSHMARSGHDITFIARGRHLEAMKENGLRVRRPDGEFRIEKVSAYTSDGFLKRMSDHGGNEKPNSSVRDIRPDVIFVCVKGYSADDMLDFIKAVSKPDTIVIPILNIFGTGSSMQKSLPYITVTDGCIYVASEIAEPGYIRMNGTILRVVFGLRKDQEDLHKTVDPLLEQIRDDLCDSGIEGILSDNIERDAMRKFSYVSPQGACGLYYGVSVEGVQQLGEIRECFAELVREISALADAMGIGFGEDIVPVNLEITDGLLPEMTTSLQRDVASGKASEIDGLIYEVVRLGKEYGVNVPMYEKISDELRARGL